MKKINLLIGVITSTVVFVISCGDGIIGSNNVIELNNVTLAVTEMDAQNYSWKVSGTILNTGDSTILAPWCIEAMFYSDSTFTETFGGDNNRMNFPLESGVTAYWSLTHSSDAVVEAEYPNFAIKNIRTFIYK